MRGGCADIARTARKAVGGDTVVVRMVMAVHTLKCIHRHGEKASGLPLWNARLHEPCRARVPEGMRGNARTAEACPCHGSPEALFYAPDGLAVLIHYGAERRPRRLAFLRCDNSRGGIYVCDRFFFVSLRPGKRKSTRLASKSTMAHLSERIASDRWPV